MSQTERPDLPTERTVGGLPLSLALFTVAPVPQRWVGRTDRTTAAQALRWLPLVGLAMGAAGGGVAVALHRAGPLVGATVAVALLALLTRGLHLDGLADLADGLGSRRPAEQARAVMRQGDVGPFGVVTVVLVLLLDVACLAAVLARVTEPRAVLLLAATVTASRGAVVVAAGAELPAAADGFGALVAGSQAARQRVAYGIVPANVVVGLADSVLSGREAAVAHVAVTAGPVVGYLLARHAARRLGGVTGDVFGAVVEVSTALSLLVLAAAL